MQDFHPELPTAEKESAVITVISDPRRSLRDDFTQEITLYLGYVPICFLKKLYITYISSL
jgi:hypothetical protein